MEHSGIEKVSIGSEKSFGLVFGLLFLALGSYPLFFSERPIYVVVVIGIVFLILGFVWPRSLRLLNKLWFKFGLFLGFIFIPIVMGLIFYLVFTPIGLLRRLFNPDPLGQKLQPKKKSYWITKEAPVSTMDNQF